MKLKPYKKTKPSGVEWLGDVPASWSSRRFGYLFRFYSGGTPSTSESELWDGDFPWVSSKDMKSMVISDTEDHIAEDAVRQSATCKLPAGSLLMVNRSGILKHSIPAAVITREMAINQDIRGCVPLRGVDSKFIAYVIRGNQPALLALWRQQGATVESLTFESVKTTNHHLPDYTEQLSIAAYLDRETGRIDALVAKKRELIERLKEKRTALISRTVTRGLPPAAAKAAGLPVNPKMKDSDIEWLGQIPGHWKASKVRHYVSILNGYAFPSAGFTREDSDMRLLRGINVGVSKIRWDETVCWNRIPGDGLSMFELRVGELVIGMDRPWVSEGVRVAILSQVDVPCLLLQRVAAIRPNRHLSKDYLFRILSSPMFVDYFTPEMTGVSVPHISPGQVGDFPIPIPPIPEQHAIAAYLDAETAKLDALVAKVEEAVERLQEYRTALITAAVTGKIDVRGHKPTIQP